MESHVQLFNLALARLRVEYPHGYEAFLLYQEGMTHAQVGEKLGVSVRSARHRIDSAKKKMLALIDCQWGEKH